MTATLLARFLEWDTQFFGVRIASLRASALPLEALRRELDGCREQRIRCVYLLSDIADGVTHRAAEPLGFHLVDVRVTLDVRFDAAPMLARSLERVRPAKPADVPALRAIAAACHGDSRFYADEHFDRERCDALYATWIERSCGGWADRVFVAELDGRPAGYLSCHLRDDGRGEIGLVGVASNAVRQGLGRELVSAGLRWFGEHERHYVTIATQGKNLAAQRLYQSAGFQTKSLELWHHLWLPAGSNP
ncbi:MAG: GNAT family N-acetyltransferase [Planctomycetota bacterium]